MLVLSWTPFVFAVALCAAVSVVLLGIGLRNPRLMLQDYPEDVRRAVPEKTPAERREAVWWIVPLFGLVFGLPLAAAIVVRLQQPELAFAGAFLTALIVLVGFNLYDLIVLDLLYFCTWTPPLAVLPGTEGMAGYKEFRPHARGFLTGLVLSLVASAVIGLVVILLPL